MSRDKSILGVHIDDDFVNIVHLGQTANGLQVHNWTSERLEAGIVKDGLIIDGQTVTQKIRNFVKADKLKPRKAVMSLSCSAVRLKPSEFPTQANEQLQKQVEDQIGNYGLFGGERIVFDYCVFEQMAQSSNKQTVLQAVTTRQISDACLEVAKKAGLDLVRIEPAVLPIIKLAFNKQAAASESVSLLLALDSASGNLSVFKNGLPQLCQNLTIGTRDLSQNKDSFARLIEQMKAVLEFAHSLTDSQQLVLKVAAACNSETLRVITEQIKQSLNDVTFEQIDCSQIAKEFGLQGADGEKVPFFALTSALTAFGVSARDSQLNLISKESLTILKTREEMSLTAKAIAAVVLLSVAALVPLKMKVKSIKAASAVIEAKVTETVPVQKNIADIRKQLKHIEGKLSDYNAVGGELINISWPEVLHAIGNTVPDKVRIVDISTTDLGDFTLTGEASAERYVYKFVKELQNDESVESAKVEEIEYDNSSAKDVIDYTITCKIRKPKGNL